MCVIDFIGSRLEIRFNSHDCGTGMREEFYNSIFENFRVDVEFLRNSNFFVPFSRKFASRYNLSTATTTVLQILRRIVKILIFPNLNLTLRLKRGFHALYTGKFHRSVYEDIKLVDVDCFSEILQYQLLNF